MRAGGAVVLGWLLIMVGALGCGDVNDQRRTWPGEDARDDVAVEPVDVVADQAVGADASQDVEHDDVGVADARPVEIVDTEGAEDGEVGSTSDTGAGIELPEGAHLVLLRTAAVVTPDEVIEEGEILFFRAEEGAEVDGDGFGRILCVAEDCSAHPLWEEATVVTTDGIAFPGLIDTHQHMNWNTLPRWDHGDALYPDRYAWRYHEARYNPEGWDRYDDLKDAKSNIPRCLIVKWAEVRLLLAGTTSVVGSGGGADDNLCYDTLVRNLDVKGYDGDAGIEYDAGGLGEGYDMVYQLGVVDEDGAFTTIFGADSFGDYSVDSYVVHIGEGVNEEAWEEFELLRDNGGVEYPLALIHGTGLTAEQFLAMRKAGGKLIWSPQSNIDLYGRTASVTSAKHMGVPIALAPDWTPSGTANLLRELHCADHLDETYFGDTFTDAELVAMVTKDAALAVDAEGLIGQLRPGWHADIVVVAGDAERPYRALLDASVEDVELVVIGGQPLYGRDGLLESFGSLVDWERCESLSRAVYYDRDGDGGSDTPSRCLEGRSICVAMEFPAESSHDLRAYRDDSLLDMQQALFAATADLEEGCGSATDPCYKYELFPAFHCGDEPDVYWFDCDLKRNEGDRVAGVYAPGAGDADGDGFPDDEDNCPTVWNAPLPWQVQGAQDDHDGDGIGDACDPCTVIDGDDSGCEVSDHGDLDADGVENFADVCPMEENAGQSDADRDGKGDECDHCPSQYNPDTRRCVTVSTVFGLRDPDDPAPTGEHYSVENAVVVGRGYEGFFVQDLDAADVRYTGIFVYSTRFSSTVERGDVVGIYGAEYQVYYGLPELVWPDDVIVLGSAELPAATVVAPADVATGGGDIDAYLGTAVQVAQVEVTSDTGDTSHGSYDFIVSGNLHVGDDGFEASWQTPSVGTRFAILRGVLNFAFSNSVLLPRDSDDMVLAD